jgi:tetratricopeptide (TPR) repeat protein
LTALGNRIAIREGATLRESDSGQYALALEIVEEKGRLHVIKRPEQAASDASADEIYDKAMALEDKDAKDAISAYEACLKIDPHHIEARINLGRLLHMQGRLPEAERVYRDADRAEPYLAFNLAVLLEDLHRESDAILAYREALAMDPQLADAHFNLARLYERARDPKASLRHLLAYRRMMDGQGT